MTIKYTIIVLLFGIWLSSIPACSGDSNETKLPCPMLSAVELTDVTYDEDGNLVSEEFNHVYTPEHFWVDYEKNKTFGCICDISATPCIRKCCKFGEILEYEEFVDAAPTRKCVPAPENFTDSLIPYENSISTEMRKFRESKPDIKHWFTLVPGFEDCYQDRLTRLALLPESMEDDRLEIHHSGVLLIKTHGRISKGGFCVENEINANSGKKGFRVQACVELDPPDEMENLLKYGGYVSVPLLGLTFLVYAVVPELQNNYGKTLMCYVGCIFVGYGGFLLVSRWIGRWDPECFTIVALLCMQSGLAIGWGSPNMARFTKNISEIHLTPDEITWVSSTRELAGVFGALLGPLCVQLYGPKTTSLISFFSMFLSWTCILVANNFFWLLIGRTFSGIGSVVTCISFAIYLGEISSPAIRGTLVSAAVTGTAPAIVLSSFLESRFIPKVSCPIYLIGCLIGMSLLIFVLPESPYFLAKSKNNAKTKQSIALYFPDEMVEEKLLSIRNFVKNQDNCSLREKLIDIFGLARTRKLIFLTAMITSLTQMSGLVNIERYMQIILERGNSHVIDPEDAMIYMNVAAFILRLLTCNLADKLGRKFLLVLSGIAVSTMSAMIGIYFSLLHSGYFTDEYGWILIACIFIFSEFYTMGFYSSLFTVLGELCRPDAKNISNCLSYLSRAFFGFVVVKIYLPVSYKYGEEYMFWIQAIAGFSVVPLAIFLLPESKRKKLEDV